MPVSASFSPDTGDPLQKIEFRIGRSCTGDGSELWTTSFKTFSREKVVSAFSDPDGDVQLEITKRMGSADEYEASLLETARAGLDSAQTKQARIAAITVRALKSGAATQDQALKDVRDILMVRVPYGGRNARKALIGPKTRAVR